MSYPFVITFPAASAVSIAAAQTLAGAGTIVINGPLLSLPDFAVGVRKAILSAGSIPNVQRVVTLTSSGNVSGANITVVGLDVMGNAVSEVKAGPSGNTVATTAEYAVVTSITSDAALGTAMSVGTGTTGKTAWFLPDQITDPTDISIYVVATATVSYTVQQTPDDPLVTASPALFNDPNLAATGTSGSTSYGAPCGGIRAIVNSSSGSGAIKLTISQARK